MARQNLNIEKLQNAIELVGGISALSSKSKISYQSIIDWRSGRKAPSVESCIKIEQATDGKISRKDLLPDFPWGDTK
ncbi:transcriptional regulator [Candidatus Finniella inopinata]|uniref:DNA-binding protein n=1 Tax=Candidatus Finniella inopinata TaxID=1696036 RepID=A0A4Q7DG41_9PROT|nr:YdaS family helix-turn-helix protein [Candidatus Finniella inopinata]RZI45105.1 DNA-binding protein [Candidatus Finniella inopinata]